MCWSRARTLKVCGTPVFALTRYAVASGRLSRVLTRGRFCAAFDFAAQSRSHAGCALGGDRLAFIGQRRWWGDRYHKRPFAVELPHPSACQGYAVASLCGRNSNYANRCLQIPTTHIHLSYLSHRSYSAVIMPRGIACATLYPFAINRRKPPRAHPPRRKTKKIAGRHCAAPRPINASDAGLTSRITADASPRPITDNRQPITKNLRRGRVKDF